MALSYSISTAYNFLTCYSAPIIALYLLMVFLSPRLMRYFSPLGLRSILILHNLICSLVSLYAVICFVIGFWQVWDPFSKVKVKGLIPHALMVYWFSKLYELLDTVFMVLRHRVRQISFLHVFHHSSITMLADWAYFLTPIPAVVPVLALNSIVHVVMYGYYFLTALHPLHEFTWKKRITQMQIIQFLIAMVQCMVGYMYHGFCVYAMLYGATMLLLFGNFYYRAFIVKKARSHKDVTVLPADSVKKVD